MNKDTNNNQYSNTETPVPAQPQLFNLSDTKRKKVEMKFTMEKISNDGGYYYCVR